jgi:hypothetical protein
MKTRHGRITQSLEPARRSSLLIAVITLLASMTLPAQGQSSSTALKKPSRSPNLFEEIMEHKDELSWEFHEKDALPSDLCKILLTPEPDTKLPFKVLGFPLGIPGKQEAPALVLSWTRDQNHPDIVLLANVRDTGASFFLLSREGTLMKTAYRSKNGPWALVSNALARNEFEREKRLWHDWLVSRFPSKHSTARRVFRNGSGQVPVSFPTGSASLSSENGSLELY